MNRTQILGLIRHILTFAGGAAAAQGLGSEGEWTEIIGGVVAITGAVWSIVEKNRAKPVTANAERGGK